VADGTVLVAGGANTAGWPRNAELYDPSMGRWKRAGTTTSSREHATAALLGEGRVLLAGGGNPSALASAELYDPASTAGPHWVWAALRIPSPPQPVAASATPTARQTAASRRDMPPSCSTR
jgi:hypothetical protein